MGMEGARGAGLGIVHVLRAPVGGLFRHVLDLSRGQIARGHRVGLITDSISGGQWAARALAELEPDLDLGLMRLPIRRNPHFSDLTNARAIARHCATIQPDVIHGHGSKGGLFARLPGLAPALTGKGSDAIRVYTPHGGSFNYKPGSGLHRAYMVAESLLARATDLFLFESAFVAGRFREWVGEPRRLARIALNGIGDEEFEPVSPAANAADFLYVGELRAAKGIDTFIDALAHIKQSAGIAYTAVLVGSGPDQDSLLARAEKQGISGQIRFPGAMPAREAFRLGRTMVVPSRAESLPYVVLEAAGACVPMIATNVGGIPEIFGPHARSLLQPDDPEALALALKRMAKADSGQKMRDAVALAEFVRSTFHITHMVEAVLNGYREAMRLTAQPRETDQRTPASV